MWKDISISLQRCVIVQICPKIQLLELNCQCYIVLRVGAFRRWLSKERRILLNETSKSIQDLMRTNNVSFDSSAICDEGHSVYPLEETAISNYLRNRVALIRQWTCQQLPWTASPSKMPIFRSGPVYGILLQQNKGCEVWSKNKTILD